MKDFIFKHKILFIILLAIPVVAAGIFIPLLVCGNNEIIDLGSFLGGLLAYIGTALLGIVAVWQNDKMNALNTDYQKRLTYIQINHTTFADVKGSITEALTAFDLHRLEHLIRHSTISQTDSFLNELSLLATNIRNAQSKLYLCSDINIELEKHPCFECDKGSADFKAYVKASVNFRNCYNTVFTDFFQIISKLKVFLKEAKTNSIKEQIIKAYDEMIGGIMALNDKRVDKADLSKYEQERQEILKGILPDVEEQLAKIFSSIIDLFSAFVDKYIDDLGLSAKVYLTALQRKLTDDLAGRNPNCDKLKKYQEGLYTHIDKQYTDKPQTSEEKGA